MEGSTVWDLIGRMKSKIKGIVAPTAEELLSLEAIEPKVYGPALAINVAKAITHCSASHSIVIDTEGVAYTFGRNDKSQLGFAGPSQSELFKVELDEKVVSGAVGKSHSLLVTESGRVYGAGLNSSDQAIGFSSTTESITEFTLVKGGLEKVKVEGVSCGMDFSCALAEGKVWAWGSPQYGQVGDGSTHEYVGKKGSAVNKFLFDSQPPNPVKGLEGITATEVVSGNNHSHLLTTDGDVYSWGCAGYSRLGLNGVTKDVLIPQKVAGFTDRNNKVVKLVAGPTCGMVIDGRNALQIWGKWKNSGDGGQGTPWMYPKHFQGLSGWTVREIGLGGTTLFALAETSCISWGQSCVHGELGLGEGKGKSATNAIKVDRLEGFHVASVSCGLGHTLLLVSRNDPQFAELKVIGGVAENVAQFTEKVGKRKRETDEVVVKKK